METVSTFLSMTLEMTSTAWSLSLSTFLSTLEMMTAALHVPGQVYSVCRYPL